MAAERISAAEAIQHYARFDPAKLSRIRSAADIVLCAASDTSGRYAWGLYSDDLAELKGFVDFLARDAHIAKALVGVELHRDKPDEVSADPDGGQRLVLTGEPV